MKLKFFIFLFLAFHFNKLYSQKIEIGQSAESVKQWINYYTQESTGYDSYGRSKGNNVEWDVKYNNGNITEVIQCFNNQLITFLKSRSGMYVNYRIL